MAKYVGRPSEHDLIRGLIIKKFGLSEFGSSNTDSNISIEEKLVSSIDSFDENEQYNNRTITSLSNILGSFSKKIDRLIELEELYSKEDVVTCARINSRDNKRRVSFADQEFNSVEYCTKYHEDSTNDEFDIETATSNDQSTTEFDDRSETESNTQWLIGEKNASHGLSSTELRSQSIRNLSTLCGVLGPPVLNLKEFSVLYTKQDISTSMEDQNFSTNDEVNQSAITSKSRIPLLDTKSKETHDVTTSYSTSLTTTPRSPSVTDSIENQISTDQPSISLNRTQRWTCVHGLPPVLECLDTTEFILIDLDNGALKRNHGIHSYNNEKVFTFKNRMGELLFYGIEHPQFCSTNTCEPHRPFEMNIYDIDGREVIKLSRFTSCIAGCLIPCFYHTLTTYCPGQIQLGKIKQDITLCIPSYTVYDNMNRDICVVRGPFGAYFSGNNLTFCVYDNTHEGYVNCGLITDRWTHEQQFMFKNNVYGVKFPLNFEPKRKILLLSAAVLLKYIYFSGSFFRRQVNAEEDYVEPLTTVSTPVSPIPTTLSSHPVVVKQPELSTKTTASIVSYEPTNSVREIREQFKPSSRVSNTNFPRRRSVTKIGKQYNILIDESSSSSTTKTEPMPEPKNFHHSSIEKSIPKGFSTEIEL
ncbi:uncharacterized protein LOC123301350 [Chrysoperla carnea]|uniref:uncharacterized protein LOC123301350 n=1 Tax=Chrysoperla carnea TaxID=189513 RepID=UPI001D096FE5|nr:uncharacterized protein LOC123301350 [Chrysoperla carnea]